MSITTHNQPPKIKRNPRAKIPGGLTPIQRWEQKRNAVLLHLYRCHHSLPNMLADACGIEVGFPQELADKRGLLRRFDTPRLVAKHGWMLTEDGVATVMAETGLVLNYDLDVGSVDHRLLRHDITVQRILNALGVLSYEIDKDLTFPYTVNVKHPDARAILKNAERALIESELTPKSGRELHRALLASAEAIANGLGERVMYFSQSETLLKNYKDAVRGQIPVWEFDRAASRWKTTKSRKLSEATVAAFSFQHLPKLLQDI